MNEAWVVMGCIFDPNDIEAEYPAILDYKCFGVYATEDLADECVDRLFDANLGSWVFTSQRFDYQETSV